MSASTVRPMSSLLPGGEADPPETEVAGDHALALQGSQGSGSQKDSLKGQEIIAITLSDWLGEIIIDFLRTNPSLALFLLAGGPGFKEETDESSQDQSGYHGYN